MMTSVRMTFCFLFFSSFFFLLIHELVYLFSLKETKKPDVEIEIIISDPVTRI